MSIKRPNSLCHDPALRFDRIAARLEAIFVQDLNIAYAHDLLQMNELSFQVSYTKRHHMHVLNFGFNPNPLIGSPSCVECGLGQIAKQLVLVRMTCAFKSGKFGWKSWTSKSVRSWSGEVSKWQSRNSRSKDGWNLRRGEGEMTERWRHAHRRHPWAMHVCNTHENVRSVRTVYVLRKNVRAISECLHTIRRTHSCCYYVGAYPCGNDPDHLNFKKIIAPWPPLREYFQTSFKFFLISLNWTWSSSLLSTSHQMHELILVGFARHALVLILDDAFVWSFESELWFIAKYYFQLCESVYKPRRIPWECTPLQFFGMSCRRLQWVAWIFVLCNSQLLSSWIFFTAFSLRLLSLCDFFCMYFSSL